ncbi:heparan-alpha-glucosaminide N-acetyltransferase [Hydrogenophaga sp. PAMC20947]|uniref:heparan-alpha-glucosaminide N-acetyltransferase n=1 Tax=Hydrogenophaga sp. PAMC20947 TaxID=2565558 RepID=UPI00109D9B7E|nr:heparan-alpha-glucosaminide N-acetyltransferase [Hydrogenophaga sp. PAMC20947]QCB48601.1 DUF1624 domain-containing protein [Hydrogenophaga sp. PAMC20947]
MTAYHFCFDLNYHGLIDQNFHHDPFWTWQRTAIVSLFLFTAGLSQAVAAQQGQTWSRFWKRWGRVAGAAGLVTVGSMLMFPDSFIYFGVLHGIAVMLILVRLTAGWGVLLWPLGALAIGAKFVAPLAIAAWPALAVLNQPGLNALGLISQLPITEDYVPVLPWLGVMWWGIAAGRWALANRPAWLGAGQTPAQGLVKRALVVLGRWSLSYYLLHQPVMLGLIAAAFWALG